MTTRTTTSGAKALCCRPRNAAATRKAILQAARARFPVESYDRVGLRAIAGDAGVDPALIKRYFGSKAELFACVLESYKKDPMGIIAGERATFGERMAAAVMGKDNQHPDNRAYIGLITHSAGSGEASEMVRQHIEQQFLGPFAAWLGAAQAREKAWLTAAQLIGITIMRGIKTPPEQVQAQLAAQLQRIVDSTGKD